MQTLLRCIGFAGLPIVLLGMLHLSLLFSSLSSLISWLGSLYLQNPKKPISFFISLMMFVFQRKFCVLEEVLPAPLDFDFLVLLGFGKLQRPDVCQDSFLFVCSVPQWLHVQNLFAFIFFLIVSILGHPLVFARSGSRRSIVELVPSFTDALNKFEIVLIEVG